MCLKHREVLPRFIVHIQLAVDSMLKSGRAVSHNPLGTDSVYASCRTPECCAIIILCCGKLVIIMLMHYIEIIIIIIIVIII